MNAQNAKIPIIYTKGCSGSVGVWGVKGWLLELRQIHEAQGKAVPVPEVKFPKDEGYLLYWILDHNSYHSAYADNSNASKMNAINH